MKVLFVTTGLGVGGAEISLFNIIENLGPKYEAHVVSLSGAGPVADRFRALGVAVTILDTRRQPIGALIGLIGLLRRFRPQVVQTWMYHADLIGGVAARLCGVRHVVWGIRNSTLAPEAARRTTIWVARLCARLSNKVPEAVVSVSHAARHIHAGLGYRPRRFEVIGNGFDLARFQPDERARSDVRAELGLPAESLLVIHVGRFHPQKNHQGLVRALGLVHREHPMAHFVMVGLDVEPRNAALRDAIAQNGLSGHCHCLGLRDDTQRLFAAADLAVLPSISGEAFPRVLGEAMACGTPCVATDVGDSRLIVADCGAIVAPGDDAAFAEAVCTQLRLPAAERDQLRARARSRAVREFDIRAIAKKYDDLYMNLTGINPCVA